MNLAQSTEELLPVCEVSFADNKRMYSLKGLTPLVESEGDSRALGTN